MNNRKKYNFTVEGNTEKLYLFWLQNMINNEKQATATVTINVKVCQSPRKASKTFIKLTNPDWTHICDTESNEAEHVNKFKRVLEEMREAVKEKRCSHYELGYSNYAFELWMILHKKECFCCLSDRTKYLSRVNKAFGTKFKSLDNFKSEECFNECLEQLTLDDVRRAIKNAEQIEKNNHQNGYKMKEYSGYKYYTDNPSLSIHTAVKKVLQECGLWK